MLQFVFYKSRFRIALFYPYRMHARAIFVRGLFAVSRIYSRFVRAIARFQRKFSVNHAKSAYFQRKSRKVSVNKHLPYK